MSMISEQVKKLKGFAEGYAKCGNWHVADTFREAADTIEALSAKLVAANMENGSGWIACEDRLPEEKGWYLVYAKNQRPFVAYFKGKTFPLNNHYHEIVAWMPLPEPYRPQPQRS